jgi:crotonobetainyl-CoA:carnitine CoA-transferase CaiB-like acyl-CoA transferase
MAPQPPDRPDPPGALADLRVVEIAGELTGLAGKHLGDLGADVIVVEPPAGAPMRRVPPFVDDEPSPDRSLRWWSESSSKRSVVLDLDEPADRARLEALLATADVVLESESATRLSDLGLVPSVVLGRHPRLVWVTLAPFARHGPRGDEPATDLTTMAGSGPLWSCGYDDHGLPPIRGHGYQSRQMGAIYAAIGALAALAHRHRTGRGQHVEVNLNAAGNTSTEIATYNWLVVNTIVQRQTGRHASAVATEPVQVRCADGRDATTGVPPRHPSEFRALHGWLEELGLLDELPEAAFLALAVEHADRLGTPEAGGVVEAEVIFSAARQAMLLIATRLPALGFFAGAQQRGLTAGAILSPEEAFENEHFVARGMQVLVEHPELGRAIRYPGAPFRMTRSPWRIARRPPLVGEHTDEVLAEIGPVPEGPRG